jgi:S1-C subfamily serine protease
MEKVGYVRIPDVVLGVHFTLPARPLIVERVDGPARDVGILENDRIVEIDGHAIKEGVDLYRALDKKNPGDKIPLKFRRGQQEMEVFPTLVGP